jgi:hypothetical protein
MGEPFGTTKRVANHMIVSFKEKYLGKNKGYLVTLLFFPVDFFLES